MLNKQLSFLLSLNQMDFSGFTKSPHSSSQRSYCFLSSSSIAVALRWFIGIDTKIMMSTITKAKGLRVVSLLPSATEMLCLIEQEANIIPKDINIFTPAETYSYKGSLCGRSHECDFPQYISHLPILTSSRTRGSDSLEIHQQVQTALSSNTNLYDISASILGELKPDVILTQNLCDVCSVDFYTVEKVVKSIVPRPLVVNLMPSSMSEILDSILQIGDAVGLQDAAQSLYNRLKLEIDSAKALAMRGLVLRQGKKLKVEFIEWTNPLFPGACIPREHYDCLYLFIPQYYLSLKLVYLNVTLTLNRWTLDCRDVGVCLY